MQISPIQEVPFGVPRQIDYQIIRKLFQNEVHKLVELKRYANYENDLKILF